VLARVGTWVTTRAAEGILVRRADAEPISVIAVPETKPVEPTGGGDALRAGFIAGRMWGLSLERATQLGSAVATAAVEVIGTQEYDLPKESFLRRFADAFGADAADEVAPHLPG
jgi:adenosine kinase